MPAYATKKKKAAAPKRRRRLPKRLPRDPVKLFRWAAIGTDEDYERLRRLARKARNSLPAHISADAFERLQNIDRLRFIEEIQASEQHDVSAGWFLDGLHWLLDSVPWGNWAWPVKAAKTAINAYKGDALNLVDEQYARLVGATYGTIEDRPFVIDHWKRQPQFDSEYVSVWDNLDGHRLIAIRGTTGTATDLGEDLLIAATGRSTDLLGDELLQIIAATGPDTVVDLAAHSLGTSLTLQAYGNRTIYDAIHETYVYNPAYSMFARGSSEEFEQDPNVRFFINVQDVVSMGGAGRQPPRNVVYRAAGNPVSAHMLKQWKGGGTYQDPIYDSPPETRVHAHKQVFGASKQSDAAAGEDVVEQDDSAGVSAVGVGVPASPATFDFGDAAQYDYALL